MRQRTTGTAREGETILDVSAPAMQEQRPVAHAFATPVTTAATNGPWVATVMRAQDTKAEAGNETRAGLLAEIVRAVVETVPGNGVVLFPAGWFDAGNAPARDLIDWVVGHIRPVLADAGGRVAVCVGADGRGACDQLGLLVTYGGLAGLARKFHPAPAERDLGLVLADDHLCQEGSHDRIVTLWGRRFYMAVCYDVFGIPQLGLESPGVDAVLVLAHGFCPKGSGSSGDVDFARKGLAGASKGWGCPAFASAVFFDRPIPPAWPSGLLWNLGDESVKVWKYADNPLHKEVVSTVRPEADGVELHMYRV